MSTNTKFTTGEHLLIDTGEYSDSSTSGPFRILRDFDMHEVAEAFRLKVDGGVVKESWETDANPEGFIAHLSTEGYIIDVENSRRIHIGSYGELKV